MNNAVKQPQTIVVLGGNSEIGRAIVAELVSPALRHVVLAVRQPDDVSVGDGEFGTAEVTVVPFDAADVDSHASLIDAAAARCGDLDVIIQAFGQLGTADLDDREAAVSLATVNYVGAVSTGLAAAAQLRRQGHGTLVVLSSVAAVRTRASNFIYGSTKAGQDGFATGLNAALQGSGARVMTVRSGPVRTAMTAGMPDAPFTTDASDVGKLVAAGLTGGKRIVWSPGILRVVFGLLRFAPEAVWRRLDR
ncbi:MAG: SDR family NAD(P)-dependent oxidoreductase [Ilumatobacteraceae bacterium]